MSKTRKKNRFKALNLGCNRNALKDFENVDIVPFRGVDTVADLTKRWPWPDDSIDFIRANDLVEHLSDKIHLMNEAWRVLKPLGKFRILVPHGLFAGGFQDPTHVSYWVENSFLYFAVYRSDDGEWKSHRWRKLYAPHQIKAAFEVALGTTDPSPDDPGPGGNYGGIVYIAAELTKRPDPGDCEAPDDNAE